MPGPDERFILPWRQLGAWRRLGWIAIAIGLVGAAFSISWMASPIQVGIQEVRQHPGQLRGWCTIAFGLVGLVGLVPALGSMLVGVAVVFERTRTIVTLVDDELRVCEKFCFLSVKRKCQADSISRLVVVTKDEEVSADLPRSLDSIAFALTAEQQGNDSFVITFGYPRQLLDDLACQLSEQLSASFNSGRLSWSDRKRASSNIQVVEAAIRMEGPAHYQETTEHGDLVEDSRAC